MKKIIILIFITFILESCSTNNDINVFETFLPIEKVDIPSEFKLGESYPITISYFKPNTCHVFKELYYIKNTNKRTVAVIDYVFERNDCQTLENELVETTFNFIVNSNGSYIFKFWQGKDNQKEDVYLTIEVPVIE